MKSPFFLVEILWNMCLKKWTYINLYTKFLTADGCCCNVFSTPFKKLPSGNVIISVILSDDFHDETINVPVFALSSSRLNIFYLSVKC